MKKDKDPSADVRALHSPMAVRMMKSLRDYREEGLNSIYQLLDGPTRDLAKRRFLTVPVRIDDRPRKLSA